MTYGVDVHVKMHPNALSAYMDVDRAGLVCFRCGEVGHVRFQCMSYKVRLCWNYGMGGCTDSQCTFAHGREELRTPWQQRCVRVIKMNGKMETIGCNSTEHTFRKCPYYQNVLLI